MAETGMKFDEHAEEEEEKPDEKTKKKGKKAKVEEIDPEELERRKAAAAKAKDIATYGVSLVMQNLSVLCSVLGSGKTITRTRTSCATNGCLARTESKTLTSKCLRISKM